MSEPINSEDPKGQVIQGEDPPTMDGDKPKRWLLVVNQPYPQTCNWWVIDDITTSIMNPIFNNTSPIRLDYIDSRRP